MKEEIFTAISLLAGINAFITAPASEYPLLLLATAIFSWLVAYHFGNKSQKKQSGRW